MTWPRVGGGLCVPNVQDLSKHWGRRSRRAAPRAQRAARRAQRADISAPQAKKIVGLCTSFYLKMHVSRRRAARERCARVRAQRPAARERCARGAARQALRAIRGSLSPTKGHFLRLGPV